MALHKDFPIVITIAGGIYGIGLKVARDEEDDDLISQSPSRVRSSVGPTLSPTEALCPADVHGAASKSSKGDFGFVDVWKRGCFAWEYKGKDKHKSLDEAYRQLYQYRDDLDNPPLSVVCDIRTSEIRAHFPGYPTEKTVIKL